MARSATSASGGSGCRPGADRGSGTVWVLAATTVLWFATTAVLAVAGAALARHRAAAAADLAALAAATSLLRGGDPCGAAARVAAGGGARLVQCAVSPAGVAEVTVTVRPMGPAWVVRLPPATGRARAGPVAPAP